MNVLIVEHLNNVQRYEEENHHDSTALRYIQSTFI